MCDPDVFKMREGILMFTKDTNQSIVWDMWRICLPESMVAEVWSLCQQSKTEAHRGVEGTLNKFLKGFFVLSARPKIRFLNGGCDTFLAKERSMPGRMGEHLQDMWEKSFLWIWYQCLRLSGESGETDIC